MDRIDNVRERDRVDKYALYGVNEYPKRKKGGRENEKLEVEKKGGDDD